MTDRRWYIAAINRVDDHIGAHLAELSVVAANVTPRARR
jgi:hypothetical protein